MSEEEEQQGFSVCDDLRERQGLALQLAVREGSVSYIHDRLKRGIGSLIDFQERKHGFSALHVATMEGKVDAVFLLTQIGGANPLLVDKWNRTPADWAAARGHERICRHLVRYAGRRQRWVRRAMCEGFGAFLANGYEEQRKREQAMAMRAALETRRFVTILRSWRAVAKQKSALVRQTLGRSRLPFLRRCFSAWHDFVSRQVDDRERQGTHAADFLLEAIAAAQEEFDDLEREERETREISRGLPVQRLAAIERQRVEVAVRRIRRIRLLASVYGALENWEAAASLAETVAKEAALLGEEGMQGRYAQYYRMRKVLPIDPKETFVTKGDIRASRLGVSEAEARLLYFFGPIRTVDIDVSDVESWESVLSGVLGGGELARQLLFEEKPNRAAPTVKGLNSVVLDFAATSVYFEKAGELESAALFAEQSVRRASDQGVPVESFFIGPMLARTCSLLLRLKKSLEMEALLSTFPFSGCLLAKRADKLREGRLIASFAGYRQLPQLFSQLLSLREIDLKGNRLNAGLPRYLLKMEQLEELVLSENEIDDLSIFRFPLSLTSLDLSANQLRELDASLFLLTNLATLNVSRNELKAIPESLDRLLSLSSFDCSANELRALPTALALLPNLSDLSIANNRSLSHPPTEITRFFERDATDTLSASEKNVEEMMRPTAGNVFVAIPPELSRLRRYLFAFDVAQSSSNLRLAHFGLKSIPERVMELLGKLRRLDLSYNELIDVCLFDDSSTASPPPSSTTTTAITDGQASFLEELDLRHNRLHHLDAELGRLSRLQTLRLEGNELLSNDLLSLDDEDAATYLKIVYRAKASGVMNMNGFPFPGTQIARLSFDKRVQSDREGASGKRQDFVVSFLLNNTFATSNGVFFEDVTSFTIADCGFLNAESLPADLFSTGKSLTRLDLSGNCLGVLPRGLSLLPCLEELKASRCGIRVFLPETAKGRWEQKTRTGDPLLSPSSPSSLSSSPSPSPSLVRSSSLRSGRQEGLAQTLRSLDLSRNEFVRFPEAVCLLARLRSLSLSFNEISRLPDSVKALEELEALRLDHNALECLPSSLGSLSRLTLLDVSHNKLSHLPDCVGAMDALKHLHCESNAIESVPQQLKLHRLVSFRFRNNPLSSIPQRVKERGWKGLEEFLRSND